MHISINIRSLIDVGEICINQSAVILDKFLQKIRSNYAELLSKPGVIWNKYTPGGTRMRFYEEVNCVNY